MTNRRDPWRDAHAYLVPVKAVRADVAFDAANALICSPAALRLLASKAIHLSLHGWLDAVDATQARTWLNLEADLQTARQHARTYFTHSPAPSFLLDPQGRILDANPAACDRLGRTSEVLGSHTLGQYVTPATHSTFTLLLGQAFDDDLRHDGEVALVHADGTTFDVRLDLAVVTPNGRERALLVVATDVTLYKRAHRDLLDTTTSQEQQIQLHAARTRALRQELDEIVAVFIQQLHPPVARALNFLAQLRPAGQNQTEAATRPFLNAEGAVQAILTLLASMDRFKQMRSVRARVTSVDLNRVLAEVLKNAEPVLRDRDLRVTSDALPTVRGDPRALYVVLDEYVANAIKFTKGREGACVHVLARENEAEFLIGVQDNGSGFNMRSKDKLFQLFGRLHPSSEYEGTGVGLINVRRTCERFGGHVWAEGKPGVGATFWFAWPKQPTLRE